MTTSRIALFTAAVAFLALGADCPPQGVVDEGFHVTPEGLELRPGALPFWVEGDETVPAGVVEDAVEWWNGAVGCAADVFFVAEPGDVAQVTVAVGYVPATTEDIDLGDEPTGVARLDYAEDGTIIACDVTISSDIAYNEETVRNVTRNELGHCLALGDDPGPPVTVDLRSIMSDPLDPLGDLTAADRARLQPYCP